MIYLSPELQALLHNRASILECVNSEPNRVCFPEQEKNRCSAKAHFRSFVVHISFWFYVITLTLEFHFSNSACFSSSICGFPSCFLCWIAWSSVYNSQIHNVFTCRRRTISSADDFRPRLWSSKTKHFSSICSYSCRIDWSCVNNWSLVLRAF